MGAEAEHVAVRRPAAATVVLVPFPAQGHISPMLRLARALAGRGVAAIVAVPDFVHRRLVSACGHQVGVGVELASIDSGVPDDGVGEPPGFAGFARAMEHHMPTSLESMLTTRRGLAGRGVACLVADVLASWAVPVAARCGVPAVGFWTAMLATYRVVAAIPELIDKGLISDHGTHYVLLLHDPRTIPLHSSRSVISLFCNYLLTHIIILPLLCIVLVVRLQTPVQYDGFHQLNHHHLA